MTEQAERHASLAAIRTRVLALPGIRATAGNLLRVVLQRWPLPYAIKQRLFNFFAHDVAPSGTVACRIRAGPHLVDLELHLEDDLSRNWYLWGYAGFEPGMTRLFQRLVRSRNVVFDVGANVGYYTVLAATMLAERGSVHAFEPAPAVYQSLLRNTQLNDFKCLRVHQVALSDTDGEASLFVPEHGFGTNGSLLPDFVRASGAVTVPTMRFDTYCTAHNVRHVDLVKVDVEGAELAVLRGMGSLLEQWRPDIIIEVLEPFAAEIDRFFERTDYRKFLITNRGLRPIGSIAADPVYRDMYLTCAPSVVGA